MTVEDVERLDIEVCCPKEDVVSSTEKPKKWKTGIRQNSRTIRRVLPVLLVETRRPICSSDPILLICDGNVLDIPAETLVVNTRQNDTHGPPAKDDQKI